MGSRPWRRLSAPPVPALIPINKQRRRHGSHGDLAECGSIGPSQTLSESCDSDAAGAEAEEETVQRSRRRSRQPHADAEPIDAAAPSRDWSGPQAPARRPRPERHRKSDRRRHKSDRLLRKRTTAITTTTTSTSTSISTSAVRRSSSRTSNVVITKPTNPRVNPIFVWVRQEDTRIVDVKCEDYDKRNRILLTKTAHGWRAIPRTETLASGTLEDAPPSADSAKQRKPRSRKSGKTKRCRPADPPPSSPVWNSPVNIESHLPSHTIPVPARRHLATDADLDSAGETRGEADTVNSDAAHALPTKCCAIVSDVASPLDNLLAVAELEFKQHQERENETDNLQHATPSLHISDEEDIHEHKEDEFEEIATEKTDPQDDCDYNEDDENHLAMTDILDRLEQSLQSPMENDQDPEQEHDLDHESQESIHETVNSQIIDDDMEDCISYIPEEEQQNIADSTEEHAIQENIESTHAETEHEEEAKLEDVEDIEEEQIMCLESDYETQKSSTEILEQEEERLDEAEQPTDLSLKNTTITLIEKTSSVEGSYEDELPTDLSTHSNKNEITEEPVETSEENDDLQPTDLSIRRTCLAIEPPRPPSQSSETIQSPQPSGIPAVPPSPDIFPGNKPSTIPGTGKSLFLESLLSAASPKLALTPEVTITRNQKEPLDLGKSRKSASPTVSCSEEAKDEPSAKRVKIEDITLKNLLHAEKQKNSAVKTTETNQHNSNAETSRLLELLTTDSEPDSLTQLKQLLSDSEPSIPDPLLVPKERLSLILSSPAREIPRLLAQRPELRLPEALAYPQLLQDPDILVITLAQLQTILHKQSQPISLQDSPKPKEREVKQNSPVEKSPKVQKPERERYQAPQPPLTTVQPQPKPTNGLANDIDAATTAAFNQMLWLPYLNHLEAAAMACGNNADFLKALNSVCTPSGSYPGAQHPDTVPPPIFPGRFPGIPSTGFSPMQPSIDYTNPLELAMWQEAMMQANLQQQRTNNTLKQPSYRGDSSPMNNQKKYHSSSTQRPHSSARTSPISHSFHQQRLSTSGPNHPYGYPLGGMRHNLQIPQYNPSSLTHQQQAMLHHQQQIHQHQQQQQQVVAAAAAKRSAASAASHRKPSSSAETLKQFQNYKYAQYMNQQSKLQQNSQSAQKSPRVTCKSLQNLLSPKKAEEPSMKSAKPAQPIDLSGNRSHLFSKLKVKQNLVDPMVASFGAKLWRHEDVPEVGSTTEEMSTMSSHHLHETQTHLWHPLFGK